MPRVRILLTRKHGYHIRYSRVVEDRSEMEFNIMNNMNSILFDSCLGSRVPTPNVRSFVHSFIRRHIGPSLYRTDAEVNEVNEVNEVKYQLSLASGMTVSYSTVPVVVTSAPPP